MLRVFMTGGGGAGSEALERLWNGRYEVHFGDADPAAIPPTVPGERRHAIPMAGPQWPAAVAEACRHLLIDVLIPAVDEELPLMPQLTTLAPDVAPLVPSEPFVALMKDKLRSMNALSSAGLEAPRTTSIDHAADIGFPCVVKPRDSRGSRGVQFVDSAEQADAYHVLARRPCEQLVAQELLTGVEWTVYVSADRAGRLRAVVPMRVDVKRGVTIRAETAAHDGILAYCTALHDRFPTAGAYNVQLMTSAEGRVAAFEVNPRVSTTLCLAVAAGADPIADLMATTLPRELRSFTPGVRLRRNWFNHIETIPRG